MRTMLLVLLGAVACAPPPPTVLADIAPTPVQATFALTLDAGAANLARPTLEPIAAPVTVTGSPDSAVGLSAAVKKMSLREGVLWVDLYFENRSGHALRDVTVELTDFQPSALYDLTVDPYAEATSSRLLTLGRIADEGVGRLSIGLPDDGSPLAFSLTLKGTSTSRASTVSTPLALSPDGKELWVTVPDADLVAVIDTDSQMRIAQVKVAGRPISVAVTPDGAAVLVASASANTVTVIDRATREVTQQFTEKDGIGREPRHLVIAPDGSRAFVSAYVGDTVTSLAQTRGVFRVEASVDVGRRPAGLSVTPDSATVLIAHYLPRGLIEQNDAWVSVLAVDRLAVTKEVSIEDAFNLDTAHCFADTIPVSPSRVTAEAVATQLAGVFLNPAGTEGWAPGTRIAPAPITERGPNADPQLTSTFEPRSGEISAPSFFLFDTREPQQTDRLLSPGAIERPGLQDYVHCEHFQLEIELEDRETLPNDEQVNRFAAFPTFVNGLTGMGLSRAIGFTRGGRRALLVSYGSDVIALHDAVTHSPASQRHFPVSGNNPVGIVLSPDGTRAYVGYESSTFVSVLDVSAYADPAHLPAPSIVPYEYDDVRTLPIPPNGVSNYDMVRHVADVPDLPSLVELTQIPVVDQDPMDAQLRRGKILFSSANPDRFPTLSKSPLGACVYCHPDGASDGSVWVTMEGERRTLSLRGGVAGRGWLHISGTHQDIAEFAKDVVAERLGGNLSNDDLAALAAYAANGIPRLQGPVVDSARAARGKTAFDRLCTSCHAGDKLTSGNPDSANPLGGGLAAGPLLHDIGTATADAHAALGTYFESILAPKDAELLHDLRGDRDLGPQDPVEQLLDFRPRPMRARGSFKAPSLVNVWDNVLFFHDGSQDTLSGAVHVVNTHLTLGMTADDELDVVEYLKTL